MPYTFGNTLFTDDDVLQRAQEKGLTIDEYLAMYPEVKPVDEGKTNGDVEDATATSTTAASDQGTDPSNNQEKNTESESETGSSESQEFKPDSIEYLEDQLWNYAFLNSGLTISYNAKKIHSKNGLLDLLERKTDIDKRVF